VLVAYPTKVHVTKQPRVVKSKKELDMALLLSMGGAHNPKGHKWRMKTCTKKTFGTLRRRDAHKHRGLSVFFPR
jgi:hypothetical protein